MSPRLSPNQLLPRLTGRLPKQTARQTPPKRRHPRPPVANDETSRARATHHCVRPGSDTRSLSGWIRRGTRCSWPNRLPPHALCRLRLWVLNARPRPLTPRPKPLHSSLGRTCFVCHPTREHLVPSPHPTSRFRRRPKSAEGHRRTGHSPKTHARLAPVRPAHLRRSQRPTTRRCWFGARYVQRRRQQAGFISHRSLRTPSRAFPLGVSVDLSAPVDVVDALGLSPAFVRAPGCP